jgi:hypothetical protein
MSDKAFEKKIARYDRLNRWMGLFAAVFFGGGIFLHSHFKPSFALSASLMISILVLALGMIFYLLGAIDFWQENERGD